MPKSTIKSFINLTELRDDACEKPSLKKNWSNFMPAVGDTICYMQNSASSESRPQAARLGTGQGAGAGKLGLHC